MTRAVAPDGSPVALYRRLEAGEDGQVVASSIPDGAEVLDLGCGAGRIARHLAALGHAVTGVDHSAEMLEGLDDIDTVLADIADLDLGRRFGAVLLASNLVNIHDAAQRDAFLLTCARHVEPTGVVLLQRLDPQWATTAQPFTAERDGIRYDFHDVHADGETLTATVTYRFDEERHEHRFTVAVLDDAALDAALTRAGLRLDAYIDERRTWVRAVAGHA